jgi:hypothetical protein
MTPMLRSSRVNNTTIEDILEGEVLAGTFLLFGCPIIILFDFGASNNFMSAACAKRSKLTLTVAKSSYMFSILEAELWQIRLQEKSRSS